MTRHHRDVVTVTQPCCPRCGSTDLLTQRSFSNGDATRTKVTKCRDADCNYHFDVVVEPSIQNLDVCESMTLMISAHPNSEDVMTTTPINITSIGQTARRLALGVTDVRETAKELGIMPAAIINRVHYYADADIQRMQSHLHQTQAKASV